MKKKNSYFTTQEIVFITTMVAFDIGTGMFMKPIVGLTGISTFFKIEMILPLTIIFFTRRWVGKFGTILVYELLWALAASFVMPMSFSAPGIIKLIPAFFFALVFEVLYYYLPKKYNMNIWGAAIIGSVANKFITIGTKVLLGYPLMNIIKFSFIVQVALTPILAILAVMLSNTLYKKFNKEQFSSLYREVKISK